MVRRDLHWIGGDLLALQVSHIRKLTHLLKQSEKALSEAQAETAELLAEIKFLRITSVDPDHGTRWIGAAGQPSLSLVSPPSIAS